MSRSLLDHLLLGCAAVIMGGPLVLLLLGAAGGSRGAGRGGGAPSLFEGLAANYTRVSDLTANTGAPSLAGMLGATSILALGVATLTTAVAFLAAYTMTHFSGRIVGACFWLTLATFLFPVEARMLNTFDAAADLGLVNTWAGMILPVLPLALATLVFRQHMRLLPPELHEAARLDGAGHLVFLRDFVIPLSLLPAGAVFLVSFILGWNQYLWPLLISVDNSIFPLMRGLNLVGAGSGPSMLLAAVSMLPSLVLVIGFQRLLTRVTAIRA